MWSRGSYRKEWISRRRSIPKDSSGKKLLNKNFDLDVEERKLEKEKLEEEIAEKEKETREEHKNKSDKKIHEASKQYNFVPQIFLLSQTTVQNPSPGHTCCLDQSRISQFNLDTALNV